MRFWKLGCCWGKGKPDFYDMLLQKRIVICGNEKMARGDWVLVCHGFQGDAIARIASVPVPCTSKPDLEKEFDRLQIDYEDWNRISDFDEWYTLGESEKIYYPKQGGICQIRQDEIIKKAETIIHKRQGDTMIDNMIKLLETAKQLVLTGAPGTGKTYLARQIAMKMILGKTVAGEQNLSEGEKKQLHNQMMFVQFHPSFDYTDFVEGLRPVKSEDGNTLGFERRDGVFKAFCRRAIDSAEVGRVDNFDVAWQLLLSELETKERLSIPLISGSGQFPLALNEYGTGLASRTYDETGKDWIRGQSKFFTKEQVYNVYLGKPGIPSGGHDNYRKAIVAYMRQHCKLAEYRPGKTPIEEKLPPYVMIIDEINRGDIAKIFGELFFAIDKGYRGQSDSRVRTQYDNLIDPADSFFGGFYVPKNVFIIGTMNDIDRNVESMDFAIRRRFTWREIRPSERFDAMWSDIADTSAETKEQARQCMIRINAVISDTNGLGPAFQIGPSYFRELSGYRETPDGGFSSLWSNHIEPLVREYLRGFPNAEEVVKKIQTAFFNPQGQQGSGAPQAD